MKVLITGACGFVGSSLARGFVEGGFPCVVVGVDNLSRSGSELNRHELRKLGVQLIHGDLRCQSDVDNLPAVDWVIDCAANPSVLAGADGKTSSRQLMEHNLLGTINVLELCRTLRAGFILMSTSRVYSIGELSQVPVEAHDGAFVPKTDGQIPKGLGQFGITEEFSTAPPLSLYGASKLASETLALEYGLSFNFPVWINRCGVLAGAGQFGRADQGIFAFWINSHFKRAPLRYIGFDGLGHQVRDCLHPRDLVPLLRRQMERGGDPTKPRLINVSGGKRSAMSLRELTKWCDSRFGPHPVVSDSRPRQFDLPWVVLNSQLAEQTWGWAPNVSTCEILEEIARHAETNPNWLQFSG